MLNTKPKLIRSARVVHRCTFCGEAIHIKTPYFKWVTTSAAIFLSKVHPECLETLKDAGEEEYTPFVNERPDNENATDKAA